MFASAQAHQAWRALTLALVSMLVWCSSLALASPAYAPLESRSQSPFLSPGASTENYDAAGVQRVNVTLAVMSRCPDALACEAAFDKVLDRVNAKTRLTMTYIGTPDNDKRQHRYGAVCKHGEQECAGNVQQLCVQDALNPVRAGEDFDLSPSAAQKKWWNFLQCQNYAGLAKIGDEDLAQRCLRLIDGPAWQKDGIADCVHGKHGRKLLQHSVKASKRASLGTSCTIVFESGKRCIRDGGAWKNCDLGHEPADFVAEIERIWSDKNAKAKLDQSSSPLASQTIPQPPSRLNKRQSSTSSAPPTQTDYNNPFAGSRTPPSVFVSSIKDRTSLPHNATTSDPRQLPLLAPALMQPAVQALATLAPCSPAHHIHPLTMLPRPLSHPHPLASTPHSRDADPDHWLPRSPSINALRTSTRLVRRQSSSNPFPFSGPNLPVPFLAFAVTAIALFVIVVCFVLLRIVMRNRRLRRLGLLPDGPFDRLLGPTREIEDTLPPPKLLEARIAHDFRPTALDADVKARGWDAVMPISAAVPPVLYSDLFPNNAKSKGQDNTTNTANGQVPGEGQAADGAASHSYPPTSASSGGLTRRLHVPSFLRRNGDASHASEGADGSSHGALNESGAGVADGDSKRVLPDASTPASVNVTVLIAMPSQRTVFPSAHISNNASALKSQRSLKLDPAASAKIDEVEEGADDASRSLRRTASIKSFRTAASARSIGDARREAFFNKMNQDEGNTANAADIHNTHLDDEDEEELPELVFGTASVPIFTRIHGSAAGREPFAGTSEAYQPLRSELMRLVTNAHEARERKAAMEAAAKQAEKDASNEDDGQTTIDARSTTQGGVAANAPKCGWHHQWPSCQRQRNDR
ncbi:hypothetical protein L1887_49699 [Cichorium endivia]|nr:hypothetical protein L1887_49699 [Cichorium endivia]